MDLYQSIKNECMHATTTDPITLTLHLMENPVIPMHNPVHHIIDGCSLLTALHNAGAFFDLSAPLDEMILRGEKMPGATCGQWGVCGSASSVGAALSIFHNTGPLSNSDYYKDHMHCTARILNRLAEIGGPRCCKRNAFLALSEAVDFIRETYGINLQKHEVCCAYSQVNPQCIGGRCPFFRKGQY